MGFYLILAGVICLFNPIVCIYDVIPDLIGFILIFLGLKKSAVAFPPIERNRREFARLIWLGAIKLAVSVFVFFASQKTADDDATVLTITFACFVAELVFFIPAMRGLLRSISYLGERCDGKMPFKKLKGITTYTTVFLFLRIFLPVVPEFFTLSDYRVNNFYDYFRRIYRTGFTVISVILQLILGIIWLVVIIKYLRRIIKEKDFVKRCEDKFEVEFEADRFVFVRRSLMLGLMIVMCAFFFNLDFYAALNDRSEYYESSNLVSSVITDWGMVNLIPDILCAAVLLIGFIVLVKQCPGKIALFFSNAVYFVTSSISYLKELEFNSKFVMDDLIYYREAEAIYNEVVILNAIKSFSFVVFLFFITKNLIAIVKSHTGQQIMNEYNKKNARLNYIQNELKRKLWFAFGAGVLSAAVSVYCVAGMPYVRILWMVDMGLTAIHCIASASVIGSMRKEILAKYEI